VDDPSPPTGGSGVSGGSPIGGFLPNTGGPALAVLVGGVLLLGTGASLVLVDKRRRRREP
jgi:LPXTG-motif cell wall-anchored protein